MQAIFLVSTLVFGAAAATFFFRSKKTSNLPFLVASITLISSLIMYDGAFVTYNPYGEALYWTRWVFYILSCTLLMHSIAEYLKIEAKRIELYYLTGLVMLTGALASAFFGNMMYLFFLIGGILYLRMLQLIFESKKKKQLLNVAPFILLGWSSFPLIFLLSPEGFSFISNMMAAVIYLALDIYTKVYFYFVIEK